MVDERTAYWGERDAARYRTRDDDPTGGDYVVAETLDANGDPVDVLLRWDDTAGEWVSGGPVNMNGEDVTNVGALDADSVSTGEVSITDFAQSADYIVFNDGGSIKAYNTRLQTVEVSGDGFKAAINQTRASGNHVVILSGTYTVNDTTFINQPNMTITGLGDGTVLNPTHDGATFVSSATGTTYQSLKIDATNQSSGDVLNFSTRDDGSARNVTIVSAPNNAVSRGSGARQKVIGCHFENSGNHDVGRTGGGPDHVVRDCIHINPEKHAVYVSGPNEEVRDLRIKGTVSGSGISIYGSGGSGWVIRDCLITGCGSNGIEHEDGGPDGEIINVTALDNATNGIQSKSGAEVRGCTCKRNGAAGIRAGTTAGSISHFGIKDCTVIDNGQSTANPGVDFVADGGDHVVISGLVATDTGGGTQTYGVESGTGWDYILIDGSDLAGNATGTYNLTGTNNVIGDVLT